MKKIFSLLCFFILLHTTNAQNKPITVSVAPIRSFVVANSTSNDSSTLVEYRVKIVSTLLDITGTEEFSIEIAANKLLVDSSISRSLSFFTLQTIANRPIESYSSGSLICNPASAIFATINNVIATGFKVRLDKQLLVALANEGYFTFWIKYDEQQLKRLQLDSKAACIVSLSHIAIADTNSAIKFETNFRQSLK